MLSNILLHSVSDLQLCCWVGWGSSILSFWMVLATLVAARGRRREQVGIVSTSDSKLKGCTVWQAGRENW